MPSHDLSRPFLLFRGPAPSRVTLCSEQRAGRLSRISVPQSLPSSFVLRLVSPSLQAVTLSLSARVDCLGLGRACPAAALQTRTLGIEFVYSPRFVSRRVQVDWSGIIDTIRFLVSCCWEGKEVLRLPIASRYRISLQIWRSH